MFSPHPVIAIACYLVFALTVTFSIGSELLLYGLLLSLPYLFERGEVAQQAWRMLFRMRWLFLSILVVYFWFTPGPPLMGVEGMPSQLGVVDGLFRCLVLVLLILAINLLLNHLSQQQLVQSLLWWLRPLSWFGLSHQRLAIRIALVLDAVKELQQHQADEAKKQTAASPISQIGRFVERQFVLLLERAEQMPLPVVLTGKGDSPPVVQWLWPLALILVFQLVPLLLKELL